MHTKYVISWKIFNEFLFYSNYLQSSLNNITSENKCIKSENCNILNEYESKDDLSKNINLETEIENYKKEAEHLQILLQTAIEGVNKSEKTNEIDHMKVSKSIYN